MKNLILNILIVVYSSVLSAQEIKNLLHAENWEKTGRGIVAWSDESVLIKDCFVNSKNNYFDSVEITFKAKPVKNSDELQIWSGFGFQDRDNRYALGLRGGNNNDLYLCRYQTVGNNKMLALESLDFQLKLENWYRFKIAVWNGNIRIYLNGESKPRLVVKDEKPLSTGKVVLGGGWINTEFKDFSVKKMNKKEIDQLEKDTLKRHKRISSKDKEALRKKERKTYRPLVINKISDTRTEINLNGKWLFKPEYELSEKQFPYSDRLNDNDWHVMNVPDFWNPVRNWLHLQDSKFPHKGSGISDNYREKEEKRCNAYTFDYEKTTAAWYRHWIQIPDNIEGKLFKLKFDAVSKVADVYVNGEYVGGHIGMFGEFELDITEKIKPGKNLIALNVKVRKYKKDNNADVNVARAVSVDINNDMLNSLPSGMFNGTEGGIWQPVKLIVTQESFISDLYAGVRTDGANFEISVDNTIDKKQEFELRIEIADIADKSILYKSKNGKKIIIEAGQTSKLFYETGTIKPKLWSPENPNLYTLRTSLYKNNQLLDETTTNIGFRTIETRGNKFYLNGKPYWLRGANHPPCGIAPNDKKLADKFMGLMHDGNQMITRSHGSPFTKVWMDAADEQGVGVSYEGSWPWLMISDIPSQELLDIWKQEMLSLVKKYRNHPSLFLWTMNNEMYFTMFYHNDPPEIRLKKWKILSDVIKEVRILSPGIPVSADSGYDRLPGDYEQNLEPNDIDDGDVDDRHIYFNWYNRDFFQIVDGEWAKRIYWSPGANPDRPFFSQEASTGYPNNDDGHFCRKYLFGHYVPQAWVGDWAYEDKNPVFSLKRHAFMTKELMETIRRTSPESAGVLLFANLCWYKNVFDAEKIEPYPVHESVKFALNPVLLSAELFGRNFYAGTKITPQIFIVNNAINTSEISAAKLHWEIIYKGKILASGMQKTPAVPFYERKSINVPISLPDNLPVQKAYCQLHISLSSDKNIISDNQYDLLITSQKWAKASSITIEKKVAVFDLSGETYKVLDFLGLNYQKLNNLTEIRLIEMDLLIVANLDTEEEVPYNWEDVRKIAGNGTNVLLIHPGKHLQWLLPDKIESIYDRKGRIVNMHIPESKVFDGIEPMELAWWQQAGREKPRVCRRSFRLKTHDGIIELANYLRPHVYLSKPEEQLKEMSGSPLLQIKEKKGIIIASEMEVNMGVNDPIAARLLMNLINTLK